MGIASIHQGGAQLLVSLFEFPLAPRPAILLMEGAAHSHPKGALRQLAYASDSIKPAALAEGKRRKRRSSRSERQTLRHAICRSLRDHARVIGYTPS